jgi:RNA polymerase sigma factor (TIGR02999 family)
MSIDPPITELLGRWRSGDRSIERELVEAVYPTLRAVARRQLHDRSGGFTLQPTELVNEAYEKLFVGQGIDWQNRDHFYGIAGTIIRRIVLDHLKSRGREKRGRSVDFVQLDELAEDEAPVIDDSVDWIALDGALTSLAAVEPAIARVVELKCFAGLGNEQIAAVEGSSIATVGRQWRFARAWLARRLGPGPAAG